MVSVIKCSIKDDQLMMPFDMKKKNLVRKNLIRRKFVFDKRRSEFQCGNGRVEPGWELELSRLSSIFSKAD